jgi:hypothetical protein
VIQIKELLHQKAIKGTTLLTWVQKEIDIVAEAFRDFPQFYEYMRSVGRVDKLLLALASTVILGSESRGTHDHILLSHYSGSRAFYMRVQTVLK